jgi:hypothetical protein
LVEVTPESLKNEILGSGELSQVPQVLQAQWNNFCHPKLGMKALLGDKIPHLHL